MNRLITIALLITALAGCSRKEDGQHMTGPVAARAGSDGKSGAPAAKRTLAYQHTLALDVPEDKVVQVFEAGQAACRALAAEQCTVMRAKVSGASSGHAGDDSHATASAQLSMRALPAAIPKLIAAFGKQAAVTEQSTSAEELSGPLEDGAKKLALLRDYRDKLEALRVRAANDIDSLIKVNHELAQVQSELDAAAGKQATLQQRVDTELLDVSISSRQQRPFWRLIGLSLREFSASLSQGTAIAISGTAYLLPWLVLLTLVIWIARKLWRRRK